MDLELFYETVEELQGLVEGDEVAGDGLPQLFLCTI